jgi:murein DD-endopeptidase MepM/ murein hydrolase activator NlpD
MGRSAPLGAVLVAMFLLVAPAGGDPGSDKSRVDHEIGRLQDEVARTEASEGVLTAELSAVVGRARELEVAVAAQQSRLGLLESELVASRARLARLDGQLEEQAVSIEVLTRQHEIAVERLERRVREIYESDSPDILSFALGTTSFSDLLDNVELLDRIGRQDEQIAAKVGRSRDELASLRLETTRTRNGVADETRRIEVAASEQRAVRDRLAASRDSLVVAQSEKEATLASLDVSKEQSLAELESLEAESAALAAQIAAAQAAAAAALPAVGGSTGAPSAAGLVWPVGGPVTSGFGLRWGRMHEGIDIAVASGTPVYAAAAGTVIYAGVLGGYGNLVVVDHGGGLATAYAHNSAYASSVGQSVAQGAVIAYSGNTGNSSGPHVHFEVRVNGTAVDPLAYL